MPDKCKCVDFQVLKLQESPDAVPHGEMPRHLQLYCDRCWHSLPPWPCWLVLVPSFPTTCFSPVSSYRYLCDKVVPGNRVTIMGIYSIKKSAQSKNKSRYNVGVGIRSAYIRVVGIQVDVEGSGEGCFWCALTLCWLPGVGEMLPTLFLNKGCLKSQPRSFSAVYTAEGSSHSRGLTCLGLSVVVSCRAFSQ